MPVVILLVLDFYIERTMNKWTFYTMFSCVCLKIKSTQSFFKLRNYDAAEPSIFSYMHYILETNKLK